MYCIGPSNGDFISKLVIKLNLNTSSSRPTLGLGL